MCADLQVSHNQNYPIHRPIRAKRIFDLLQESSGVSTSEEAPCSLPDSASKTLLEGHARVDLSMGDRAYSGNKMSV